jgi:hypothetical protein
MATVTTNYGFDIPQSSDLVKDGATAIALLGQDIDTAMNTALGTKKAGMVLLNTTSFSAVASQSINSVFDSTYDNYKVIVDFTGTTFGATSNLRLRTVSDDTNALYQRQYATFSGTTSGFVRTGNATTWDIQLIDTYRSHYEMEIGNPNLAIATSLWCTANRAYNLSTTADMLFNSGGHNSSTQFTGFTFYASAGTITGSLSVYGYNK